MIKSFLFYTFLFASIHGMRQNSKIHVVFQNTKTNQLQFFVKIKPVLVVHDNHTQPAHYKPIPLQNFFANLERTRTDIDFAQVTDSIKNSNFHDSLKKSMLTLFEPITLFHSLLFYKNRHIAYHEIMHEFEHLIYQMIDDKIINNQLNSISNTTEFMQKDYYEYFLSKVQKIILNGYKNEIEFYKNLIISTSLVTLLGIMIPSSFKEDHEAKFIVIPCYLLWWELCFYYNFYHKYSGCTDAINALKIEIK
jgi:hypothetical protein